jgi:ATP-dependent helicase/nuclease subunit A
LKEVTNVGAAWTNEQTSAIEARSSNLLVAAAAGSGKTAVLVERIIRIVTKDKADIDSLLVVTFTNAAASEMRERIGDAIEKALEENPSDSHLQRQLTLLGRSSITTIHSFCLELIRSNFHLIDLDPAFRIADETESGILKDEALDQLLEEQYEKGEESFIALVDSYGGKKDDSGLKALVLDLHRFVMSSPWPGKWLDEAGRGYDLSEGAIERLPVYGKVLDNLARMAEIHVQALENAIETIRGNAGISKYEDMFLEDLIFCRQLKDAFSGSDKYDSIRSVMMEKSWTRLGTAARGHDKSVAEDVKEARGDFKKFIEDLSKTFFKESGSDTLEMAKRLDPLMKHLSFIEKEFIAAYDARKRDKGLLDFNDLEQLALKILSNVDEEGTAVPSPAALALRTKFREVMVDEYQDSNEVQEVIISMVSRKDEKDPNVFMVGDVKQSIYRFRQARPELFLEKYRTYSPEKLDKNRKVLLYKNFRSRRNILSAVNLVFKGIMSSTAGELDYTDDEALDFGAGHYDDGEDPPVEVILVETSSLPEGESQAAEPEADEESGMEDGVDISDYKAIELEAIMVGKKIRELVLGDNPSKVYDRKLGGFRKASYRDIVILMRATSVSANIFLEEFSKLEIPAFADNSTGYFETVEVRTMVSLLRIIDNPLQDVPLLAALRSPMFAFSEEELASVRLLDKEDFLYNCLVKSGVESIGKKAGSFLERLSEYRDMALRLPLDSFIWYLYTDTSYYDYAGAMPDGIQRQANLRMLFQKARQFEDSGSKGLFSFIRYIDKFKRTNGDIGAARILGENEDLVRVMSIHKSKGLEFPIVFISNSGKGFNRMDQRKDILFHPGLGFGPMYIDRERSIKCTTFFREAIKDRMMLESLSEEMRVLYVAMTRAKERLYITGNVRDREAVIKRWNSLSKGAGLRLPEDKVLKSGSFLDWIMPVLLKHKSMDDYRNEGIGAHTDEGSFSLEFIRAEDLFRKGMTPKLPDEYVLTIDSLSEPTSSFEIMRRLSYEYGYAKDVAMASKITVSELKRLAQDEEDIQGVSAVEEEYIERPLFMMEKTGLTGSELGTAFHKVFQHLDFSKVSLDELRSQVDELVDRELLRASEASRVNPWKLKMLFDTDIGKRMAAAAAKGELKREIPFFMGYEGSETMVKGVIDAFFEEKQGLVIVDYKTDHVDISSFEETLKDRYTEQMRYYKNALERITGLKVSETILYSVSLGKEICITL